MKYSRYSARLICSLLTVFALIGAGCYEELPVEPTPTPDSGRRIVPTQESPFPTTHPLSDIWVDEATGTMFLVGYYGTMLKVDNSDIQRYLHDSVETHLISVWGTSASSVFACGQDGTIIHFKDDSLIFLESGTSKFLTGVWGTSDDDIFFTGYDGTILRFNGTSIESMETPVDRDIYSIWGSSSDNVYAVGQDGLILTYNGTTWDTVQTVVSQTLRSVWGFGEDTLYAVGNDSRVVFYDALDAENPWKSDSLPGTSSEINAVWGATSDKVYAATDNGIIYRITGASQAQPMNPVTNKVYGLGGRSSSELYICGDNGSLYLSEPGITVDTILPIGTTESLLTVWGLDRDEVFAAGVGGTIVTRQGNGWRPVSQPQSGTISDFWGANSNTIFAAAQDKILRFNGNIWSVDFVDDSEGASYRTIWGRDAHDVYAAGYNGKIIHYDGISWKEFESGVDSTINAIRGDQKGNIYTAGAGGIVMRYDGNSWQRMTANANYYYHDLLVRSSTNIFAVGARGNDGCVMRYDGTSWTEVTRVSGCKLYDIWGYNSNELYAVGDCGTVRFFNGSKWFSLESSTFQSLYGIWGESVDEFFVVGSNGHVVRYEVATMSD